jgi:hypothetical protein
MRPLRWLAIWTLLLSALVPAGAAAAETRTFLNTEGFGPSEAAATKGPANNYPGTVDVAGIPGTVTRVTLTALELSANADLDMALVGPNGAQVMLMSDACSATSVQRAIWTFEDEAPIFVPQLSCPFGPMASVRPTNYEPESDDLSAGGGPTGPFTNSLSAFDGISPNGEWSLFLLDDSPAVVGFEMRGFALNLEIEPPPPAPPTIQTVFVPGPSSSSGSPSSPAAKPPAKTGLRAAAMAKCKAKKSKAKRAKCRAKARMLPV